MKSSFKVCGASACKFMNISHALETEQQTAAGPLWIANVL